MSNNHYIHRRATAENLVKQYAELNRTQDQPHLFSSRLDGGFIAPTYQPLGTTQGEPSSLYVGSGEMHYPKALLTAVEGVKNIDDKIPEPVKRKVKNIALEKGLQILEGSGRKPRAKRGGKLNIKDIFKGAKDVYNIIPEPIKQIALKEGLKLLGAGRKPRVVGGVNRLKKAKRWTGFVGNDLIPTGIKSAEAVFEASKRMGGKIKPKRKPNARALIVKQVMQKMGLSLPQASSYVKQNNLY